MARGRIRLPPIIRRYEWSLVYLLVWLPYIAIYQLLNRFPVREPIELSFTWADTVVPFTPSLLPLYVGYLPFYFWTVARAENDREANRVFYGTHLQLLLSVPVFLLFPVRMPRELFYGAELYGWADVFWRWFDAPNNCLPSLHASNCMLLMQLNWRRPGRLPATALALAIIASTVFVKQHYVVDVIAGGGVYVVARAFLARLEVTGLSDAGWLPGRER